MIHDDQDGTLSLYSPTDLVQLVRASGVDGLTAKQAAAVMFSTDKPDRNEIQKARRRLDVKVRDGVLVKLDGSKGGRAGEGETAWFLAS